MKLFCWDLSLRQMVTQQCYVKDSFKMKSLAVSLEFACWIETNHQFTANVL